MFALASDSTVVEWNSAAVRVLAWRAEDVIGAPAPLRDPASLLKAVSAAGEEGVQRIVELRREDGSPVKARVRAGRRAGGGARIAVLDVLENEAWSPGPPEPRRFQEILDAIPAPIYFKDAEGVYRGCNAAFEAFLGLPREGIIGATVYGVSAPELAETYREADRKLFAQGGNQVYEADVRSADGSLRRVVFHKSVIKEAGGTVGLAGAIIDVTERRAAEKELRRALDTVRRSELAFRSLVESTPDLVVIHRDGSILYANPAMLRALVRTARELEGSPVLALVHPDDRDVIAGRLDEVDGGLPPREARVVSSDGRVRRVEFLSAAIDIDGVPARVAFGRDVTERRELEARLAHADRLTSLGTLAAGVAHELNNPLSFVTANVAFVAEALTRRSDAPADVLAALDEALQGAERMRMIVRDLRTLSRADDDVCGSFPLVRVLDYAAKLAAAEIRPRARVRWMVPPTLHIQGDEGRIGQVFLNLLVNAAHAIPEGAPEAHEIRISAAPAPGGRVAVEVADTGCGMAEEIRSRVFEPFFTTKPVGRGTGLGLWVCQHIVTAHHGEIELESTPGAGTVFRILLPAG